MGLFDDSHVFNLMSIQKINPAGKVMVYQRSCLSIVFWLLQSIFSFYVMTHWVSVLGRRSSILHDNTMRQHDSIMDVVEKLTKESHFIPVKSTYKVDSTAKIFMKEIFRLHVIPKAMISNRDTKFISNFWKVLFADLGTKLNFGTAYHP